MFKSCLGLETVCLGFVPRASSEQTLRLRIASRHANMAVHLIETSEEDSYLAVARHISDLLNEGEVSRRTYVVTSFTRPAHRVCNDCYVQQRYRVCSFAAQVNCGLLLYSTRLVSLQARTALADTPGSRFTQDSEAALAEGRFGDLLTLLVPHFDVLFQKTSGTGKK